MAAFTLAHLSDPHLPPLPAPRLADLAGKRALGYLNWTRNRHKFHRRDVLDALVSDMQAQAPDHIAVTGDLVNLALEAEFAPARAWLESVGAPDRVTVDSRQSRRLCSRHPTSLCRSIGTLSRGDDAPDGGAAFPFLRRRGPLALIGVSSAVPTPPLMATGWLGRAQLDALERILTRLSAEQAFRVLLIHHPLRSDSRAKRLTDFGRTAGAVETARRRVDPARARSRSFDDVVRRAERRNPRDRRAVGLRARAWPLSRRGL